MTTNQQTTPPADVGVVIVNYNGAPLLSNCLRSVTAGTNLCVRVCVIDNGSTDGSLALLRNDFPDVQVIANAANLGFAAATNQGLAVANARHLLLLNNDTIMLPGALDALVQTMDAHPALAGLGPRLLNRDGTVQPSCMHFPSLTRAPRNFLKARAGGSAKFVPAERSALVTVAAVTGACLLIRRQALETIGLLDDGYFMYAEETDWCYRAMLAGWQIGYLPTAEVIHFGGQTAAREQDRFYVERRFSRVRFHRKHNGRVAALVDATYIRANLVANMLLRPSDRRRTKALLQNFNQRVRTLAVDPLRNPATSHTAQAQVPVVAHLTSVHPPFDNRIFHKECKSLVAAGYRVVLVAPHSREETVAGVHILPIAKSANRWVRSVQSTWAVFDRARRSGADLFHIHDPELLPIAPLLRLLTGKPVIYDIHEDYVESIRVRHQWPTWFRFALATATAVIEPLLALPCILVLAERCYLKRFPHGHLVLNYPSLKSFAPVLQASPSRHGGTHLLYTGTNARTRGALSHARLLALEPNLHLSVVGRTSARLAEEMRAVAESGAERIHFNGDDKGVAYEEILAAYQSGRYIGALAIFPDTAHYREKELTKLFEYMAAAIPVICSAFPAWRAVVEDNEAGICVDPTNESEWVQAIRTLQANPALAERMGQNGRRAVLERYTWEREERTLLSIYAQVLGAPPAPPAPVQADAPAGLIQGDPA